MKKHIVNKQFLKYLYGQPDGISKFWLYMYSKSARNDIYVTNMEELMLAFDKKESSLVMILNEKEVSKFVSIAIDDNIVTADFKPKVKRRKNAEEKKSLMPVVVSLLPAEKVPADIDNYFSHALDQEELKFNPDGTLMFEENLRKCLIMDYKTWYENRQRSAAFLVGNLKPTIVSPKIEGIDVKFLRLIAVHIAKSIQTQVKTKGQVIRSIRRIYSNWENLNAWCQKGILPQQIYSNINTIIDTMLTMSNQTKAQKRNDKFSNKIAEARSRSNKGVDESGETSN